MENVAEKRIALITLGWSLLCALTIIGASQAHKNLGTPDLTYWIVAFWWAGFGLALAIGLRGKA
jgi:hypothetical protein